MLFVANVAKAINVKARSELIQNLKRNSRQLFDTAYIFSRFLSANDLIIKSFFEGMETEYGCSIFKKRFLVSFFHHLQIYHLIRTFFKVVDRQSAMLLSSGEEPNMINATHSGMCKYHGRSDTNYEVVRNAIRELVRRRTVNHTRASLSSPIIMIIELLYLVM